MPTDKKAPSIGAVEWCDLTVQDASNVKDFYCNVIGWESAAVSMGDYDDFNITLPDGGDTITGICHARGGNSNLPPQWLMYVRVASVADSAAICIAKGGKVIEGPREMAGCQFCVIKDPEGAVLALLSD